MGMTRIRRVWAAPAAIAIGIAAGALGAARPALAGEPVKVGGYTCSVVGTAGKDVLRGTPGRDVICGLGGDDFLFGFGGSDVLLGGSGDDAMLGGGGADRLRGGPGVDVASWADHSSGVRVSLDGVANDGSPGEYDLAGSDVEDLVGGEGPDVLEGDAKPNRIKGHGGDDKIKGGEGKDTVEGGDGDNTIDGENGSDIISCGSKGHTTVIAGLGDIQGLDCRKAAQRLPLFTGRVSALDADASTMVVTPGTVDMEPWSSSGAAREWIDRFAPTVDGQVSITFTMRVSSVLRLTEGPLVVGDQVIVTAVATPTSGLAALAVVAMTGK